MSAAVKRKDKRVLIYSHDSFGLGHLRRCREIAHALVAADLSSAFPASSSSGTANTPP
jgi:predicted glycosyltransferase